jgi:superfamily II DNA/RNA helicase
MRTARAGATGAAISLCDANERDQLHDIERLIRQSIPTEDRHSKAGRLDNRPRMCIQSGRTLAARPSVQWTITKAPPSEAPEVVLAA